MKRLRARIIQKTFGLEELIDAFVVCAAMIIRGHPVWYCQLNDIQTAQPINGFIPLLLGHDLGAGHLLPFTECP